VPGVSDLAAAGGLPPPGGGPLCWWFASSARADTANTASSDTNGRTNVDRVDALILENPLWPRCRHRLACRSTETLKPTSAPKDDAANIADRLIAPCLVTNP
jgi:hypothetical protein